MTPPNPSTHPHLRVAAGALSPMGTVLVAVASSALLTTACGSGNPVPPPGGTGNNGQDAGNNGADVGDSGSDVAADADTGDEDTGGPTGEFGCGDQSLMVTPDGIAVDVTVTGDGRTDFDGFSLEAAAGAIADGVTVSAGCSDEQSIVPEGFVPISAAIAIEGSGQPTARRFRVGLPYRRALVPDDVRGSSIRVFFKEGQRVTSPALPDIHVCEPNCEMRLCGDDGCGGSCGSCDEAGSVCNAAGRCRAAPTACGDDSCADGEDCANCPDDCGDCDDESGTLGRLDRGGIVRFETERFGVYQAAIAEDAGQTYGREYVFRAITGISMGGGGASLIGFRNPELFDAIGALGGPVEWTYILRYIHIGGMGGFCPNADPGDPDTWKCPRFTPTQEFEHAMEFDDWWFSTGEGTGGTFDREEYVKIFQDLTYAFGNMISHNPNHPFLPPGVPETELDRPASEICEGDPYTIETGFYDDEYNVDGSLPVIAFCDGRGSEDRDLPFDRYCDTDPEDGIPDQPNRGYYPGPEVQDRPIHIAMAVDYNGNGLRDRGEPVIRNFWEPWQDTGVDGIADEDEPGYDENANPDPNGDNYHWSYNPLGTENNWTWEDGEPYEDVGLDGVAGTPQVADGGYDVGEGNGQFDYNPAVKVALERTVRQVFAGYTEEEKRQVLDHLDVYTDGGVRDIFNFGVAANELIGTIQGHGGNTRVYDDFTEFAERDTYQDIDVTKIDFSRVGDHVNVRYGSLDATEEEICLGDGKHVGEIFQTINRILLMFGFIINRFPDGDYRTLEPPYASSSGSYSFPSPALGGARYRYSIALPPGYEGTQCTDGIDNDGDGFIDGNDGDCVSGDHNNEAGPESLTRCNDGVNNDNDATGLIDMDDPECDSPEDDTESDFMDNAEFPVIYLLHGYGQSPDDYRPSLVFLAGYMAGGFWPKAILVFPDGFCGETLQDQCNDGIDNDGDDLIDGADEGCDSSNSESGENVVACADGVDNDLDGQIDDDDHGCSTATDNDEADCVQGTFYTNHEVYPDGTTPGPQYEDAFLELVEHIDDHYRTRAPLSVDVTR